jgi:hypothetical protein
MNTLALPDVITPALTPPYRFTFCSYYSTNCPANTATVQVTATGGLGSLDFDIIEFNNLPTTHIQRNQQEVVHQQVANLPPGLHFPRLLWLYISRIVL